MAAELKRIHITAGNQNGMLRNQKIIIGLDSFSNQRLIHLDNTSLCIDYTVESCKIQTEYSYCIWLRVAKSIVSL